LYNYSGDESARSALASRQALGRFVAGPGRLRVAFPLGGAVNGLEPKRQSVTTIKVHVRGGRSSADI